MGQRADTPIFMRAAAILEFFRHHDEVVKEVNHANKT